MRFLVLVGVGLALAGAAWVRLAPSDPAVWHVDPKAAAPGEGRFVVRPEGGDVAFPVSALSPAELLGRLDAVAMATPRTMRLAGSVDEGRITYVTRTKGLGFPDYTTVEAVEGPGGTSLAIFARLRFGKSDLGVNRARVEGWLAAL